MLLTNCFPTITGEGSFVVGKAAANAGCYAGSSPVYFEDSGVPYDPDSPEPCVEMVESGNCARAFGNAAAGACSEDAVACHGAAAVVSSTRDLWRTLAHEVAHLLGAGHTFAAGGLMAYSGERAFAGGADVCAFVTFRAGSFSRAHVST